MQMCKDHGDRLLQKLTDLGLRHLIPHGKEAAAKMHAQLLVGKETAENFEPMTSACFSIYGNCLQLVERIGGSPLYFLSTGPEDRVDTKRYPQAIGRNLVWSKCPLCYINTAHELTCREKGCRLPRVGGYDFWLDNAARDAFNRAKELGLIKVN